MIQPPNIEQLRLAEERRAAEELSRDLESRRRAVREADTMSVYAVRFGASNPPFDCEIFSPDYRLRLSQDDPIRDRGRGLREYGSKASLKTMAAAHQACLSVLGLSER